MLILTDSTLFLADDASDSITPESVIEEEDLSCVCAGESAAAAARDDGSVAVIHDGYVEHLEETAIVDRIECLHLLGDDPVELLIGTESAHVFRLTPAGPALRLESFDQLECRDEWYTPWGGPPSVRSFAGSDDCVYADIHVGSIMRSIDRGCSWEPVTPDLHEDVHQVATCADAPERVYANTAHAVYTSDDRGQTWDHRARGFSARYGRAIAVHPSDPDCVLASVSDGPHSVVNGKLYRTDDSGGSWTHVTAGFPSETRDNIDTFQLSFSKDGRAWASVEERLYVSVDRGREWSVAWEAPQPIVAIAC